MVADVCVSSSCTFRLHGTLVLHDPGGQYPFKEMGAHEAVEAVRADRNLMDRRTPKERIERARKLYSRARQAINTLAFLFPQYTRHVMDPVCGIEGVGFEGDTVAIAFESAVNNPDLAEFIALLTRDEVEVMKVPAQKGKEPVPMYAGFELEEDDELEGLPREAVLAARSLAMLLRAGLGVRSVRVSIGEYEGEPFYAQLRPSDGATMTSYMDTIRKAIFRGHRDEDVV